MICLGSNKKTTRCPMDLGRVVFELDLVAIEID